MPVLNSSANWPARIEKTPGVCGGAACIRETRIPVWLLVRYRRLGATESVLLESFPSLLRDDLAAAWEYEQSQPAEIAAAIAEQEAADRDG